MFISSGPEELVALLRQGIRSTGSIFAQITGHISQLHSTPPSSSDPASASAFRLCSSLEPDCSSRRPALGAPAAQFMCPLNVSTYLRATVEAGCPQPFGFGERGRLTSLRLPVASLERSSRPLADAGPACGGLGGEYECNNVISCSESPV